MLRRVFDRMRGHRRDGDSVEALQQRVRELEAMVQRLQAKLDQQRAQPVQGAAGVGSFAEAAVALSRGQEARVQPAGALAEADAAEGAADESPYWGPVDNASARARGSGKQLVVELDECIACGTCVEHSEAVFGLRPDGMAEVLTQDGPMDEVQAAIDACPTTCILWR